MLFFSIFQIFLFSFIFVLHFFFFGKLVFSWVKCLLEFCSFCKGMYIAIKRTKSDYLSFCLSVILFIFLYYFFEFSLFLLFHHHHPKFAF